MYKVHFAVNFETMSRLNEIILQNFAYDIFPKHFAGLAV